MSGSATDTKAAAWTAAVLDASAVVGALPVVLSGALRAEMPAAGGSDVLVGGSGEDLLVGGEGRNLLVGGYTSDRGADHATLDAIMAQDWGTPDGPDTNPDALAPKNGTPNAADDFFLLGGEGDAS